jgi:hypothetical protein
MDVVEPAFVLRVFEATILEPQGSVLTNIDPRKRRIIAEYETLKIITDVETCITRIVRRHNFNQKFVLPAYGDQRLKKLRVIYVGTIPEVRSVPRYKIVPYRI